MAERILMTALSPTMEEGTITAWKKKEGDLINPGDVICEVETDKASMDYESTQEGVLLKVVVPSGGGAKVGEMIGIIGSKGEDFQSLLSAPKPAAAGKAEAPKAETSKAEAAKAEAPKAEASKFEAAAAAPAQSAAAAASADSAASAGSDAAAPRPADGGGIKASPLARKLAAERNINLRLLSGSGPGGRITKRDVEQFRGVPMGAVVRDVSRAAAGAADQEIPVSGRRAVIAKRLSESKFSAPHYYLKVSVAMEAVLQARAMLNEGRKSKVSLNAFLIKFAAEALKRHPIVNAGWKGETIVQFGSIDIGLAVDVGNGLITPVVRNCGNRGVEEIDRDLQELIEKAGANKLKPEEYTGATFTISNLGSFGVEEFTAIINPPGSAILALGQTKPTPVVGPDGAVKVANIMKMTLSCDHRVIDGAAGGRFISDLAKLMEQPARLLF